MLILSADDAFNIGTRQFFCVNFLLFFVYLTALNLRKFESVLAFSSFLTGRERSTSAREKEGVTRVGEGAWPMNANDRRPQAPFPVSGDVTGAARVGSS